MHVEIHALFKFIKIIEVLILKLDICSEEGIEFKKFNNFKKLKCCSLCHINSKYLWKTENNYCCEVCYCWLNLTSKKSLQGKIIYIPDLLPIDFIHLYHELINKYSSDKKTVEYIYNWLSQYNKEVVNYWGSDRPIDFAEVIKKTITKNRIILNDKFKNLYLLIPIDVFINEKIN